MAAVLLRGLLCCAATGWVVGLLGVCSSSAAWAAPPPRFFSARPGKFFMLLYVGSRGFSEYRSSETAPLATASPPSPLAFSPPGFEANLTSTWRADAGELGITAGFGAGSWMFLRSLDFSLYIPFYFRSYKFIGYLWEDDVTWTTATLYPSLLIGKAGSGLGDVQLGAMAMVYANPEAKTWMSSSMKLSFASAPSTHERFVKMLHGWEQEPGGGAGVARLIPSLSGIKMMSGTRLYMNVEYILPLGTENFSYRNPVIDPPKNPIAAAYSADYRDSEQPFVEEIKLGRTFHMTLGLLTKLNILGIQPGFEIGFRQVQKASWQENGRDGTARPDSPQLPNHTPEFLNAAAWAVGNLALKNNAEVEFSLVGSAPHGSDMVRFGLSYITGTFGTSIGIKLAFMSMFVEKRRDEINIPGFIQVKEIEVSPVLDAPPPPTKRIRTGVTVPMSGAGISQEETAWVDHQIRREVNRLRGYDLLFEQQLLRVGEAACGDLNCGTRIGRMLDLQAMMISRLDKVADPQAPGGSGFVLTIHLINVAEGTIVSSQSITAPRLEELKAKLPELFTRLTRS